MSNFPKTFLTFPVVVVVFRGAKTIFTLKSFVLHFILFEFFVCAPTEIADNAHGQEKKGTNISFLRFLSVEHGDDEQETLTLLEGYGEAALAATSKKLN